MALVLFTCRATGPFIMFRETAEQIFKLIGRPLTEEGAFAADELPEILTRLEEAKRLDKERVTEIERGLERQMRRSTYEEEEKLKLEEKALNDRIHFFQRVVPLEEMIRRAIRHDEGVVWGRP